MVWQASLIKKVTITYKGIPYTPQEKESLQREIESADGRIDRLVYDLYGLSEDEIRIVES